MRFAGEDTHAPLGQDTHHTLFQSLVPLVTIAQAFLLRPTGSSTTLEVTQDPPRHQQLSTLAQAVRTRLPLICTTLHNVLRAPPVSIARAAALLQQALVVMAVTAPPTAGSSANILALLVHTNPTLEDEAKQIVCRAQSATTAQKAPRR